MHQDPHGGDPSFRRPNLGQEISADQERVAFDTSVTEDKRMISSTDTSSQHPTRGLKLQTTATSKAALGNGLLYSAEIMILARLAAALIAAFSIHPMMCSLLTSGSAMHLALRVNLHEQTYNFCKISSFRF